MGAQRPELKNAALATAPYFPTGHQLPKLPVLDHYGLAGRELADDVVGIAGELEKKFRSRCRKFAGRSTITSAGAGANFDAETTTVVDAGGILVAQPQSASTKSNSISRTLFVRIAHFPFIVRRDGGQSRCVLLLGFPAPLLEGDDLVVSRQRSRP